LAQVPEIPPEKVAAAKKSIARRLLMSLPVVPGTWSPLAVKRTRRVLGLTQHGFGKRCGLTEKQVADVETGRLGITKQMKESLMLACGETLNIEESLLDRRERARTWTTEERVEDCLSVWDELRRPKYPAPIRNAAARNAMEYMVGKPVERVVQASVSVSQIKELADKISKLPMPKGYDEYLKQQGVTIDVQALEAPPAGPAEAR
jgi:transcriptional regulator with XRE-family HTH domain